MWWTLLLDDSLKNFARTFALIPFSKFKHAGLLYLAHIIKSYLPLLYFVWEVFVLPFNKTRTKIRSPWRFSNYIKVTDIEHSNYMKSIPSTIWMSSNRIDQLSIHFIRSWWDFLLLLSSAYWCSLLRLPLDVLPKTNKPERAIRNFHRRSPAVDSMIDLICSESRPNYTPEDFPCVLSSFSFFALFISSSIWNLHPRTWSFIRLQ